MENNDILLILNIISNESSTNTKQSILDSRGDNNLLKEVFRLTYDKRLSFGIKAIPDYQVHHTVLEGTPFTTLSMAVQFINESLITRKVTGNDAIEALKWHLERLSLDDAEVLKRIIKRDLECGLASTQANKTWKDLIPKQPQMLCVPQNDKNLARIKTPAYAQLKADGARCFMNVIYDTKNDIVEVNMVSRAGNEYTGLEHLKEQISDYLLNKSGWVKLRGDFIKFTIDGELVSVVDGKHAERAINNGILNKSLKDTISEAEAKDIKFIVWDLVNTHENFKIINLQTDEICYSVVDHHGDKDKEIGDRYTNLGRLIKELPAFELIETTIVYSLEEAQKISEKYILDGYEGIILKNISSPWKDGRSNDQVKFKQEIFIDLKIVGFLEHSKEKNSLGSLQLSSNCGNILVNVGTGFTDTKQVRDKKTKEWVHIPIEDRPETDREQIWSRREELLGTIIEVKCNALTTDEKRDTYSLFLPVFERFRHDKDEANNLEDVFEI